MVCINHIEFAKFTLLTDSMKGESYQEAKVEKPLWKVKDFNLKFYLRSPLKIKIKYLNDEIWKESLGAKRKMISYINFTMLRFFA